LEYLYTQSQHKLFTSIYILLLAGKIQPCMVKVEPLPKEIAKMQNITCIYCSEQFSYHESLRYHISHFHAKERIKCPMKMCKTYFKTAQEQQNHIFEVHDKSKKSSFCKFCGAFHLNFKSAWSHMKTQHKNVIRCSYRFCPSFFKTSDEQKQHMKLVHEHQDFRRQCVYCNIWFQEKYLVTHVRLTHGKVAIKCTQLNCRSFFKCETDRQDHMEKVHVAVEKKKMIKACLYCGRLYFAYALSSHIYREHRKIMVRCSYVRCTNFFHTKEELDKHFEETHKDKEAKTKKKYHCDHCNFKTNKRYVFFQHFSVMHGSEKLVCDQCPKSERFFRSKFALNRHVNQAHSGFKNSCPHCKKKFISNHAAKIHVQSVECRICNKKCLCSGLMTIHRKECRLSIIKSKSK
jgi:hypothetical protein